MIILQRQDSHALALRTSTIEEVSWSPLRSRNWVYLLEREPSPMFFWIGHLCMNRNVEIAVGAVRSIKCILLVLYASLVLRTLPADSFSMRSTVQLLSKGMEHATLGGQQLWQSNSAGKVRFNSQSTVRDVMTAVWRDSVVSLTIPASKERTYALFSSLDQHPTW